MVKDEKQKIKKEFWHWYVSYYNKTIAESEDGVSLCHEVPLLENKGILYHHKKKKTKNGKAEEVSLLPIPEIYL